MFFFKDHNIEPEFKPEVKGYTLNVESYNKEAVIHARANHDHVGAGTRVTLLGFRNGVDKYQIGSELVEINEKVSLAYGSNNFEIRVTSENGTVETYKLTIYRKPIDVDLKDVLVNGNNAAYVGNNIFRAYVVPGSKAEIKVRGNDPRAVATLNNGVISNPGDYAVMEMDTKNIPGNVNEVAVKVAVTDGSVVVEKNYKLEVVAVDRRASCRERV